VSSTVPEYVVDLLQQSLRAWGLPGEVARSADGGLEVRAATAQLCIRRAPAGLPFRWLVEVGERRRPVSGVPGLLRTVRASLDPSFRPIAARIAALPLAP